MKLTIKEARHNEYGDHFFDESVYDDLVEKCLLKILKEVITK